MKRKIKFFALLFVGAMTLMGFVCLNFVDLKQAPKTPTDLSGTVWKGYWDADILTCDRYEYEHREGSDGLEIRFIGKNIVSLVGGDYYNGKFKSKGGTTVEYTYNVPKGKLINKATSEVAEFTINGNTMICYVKKENGRIKTISLIRVK